MIVNFLNILIKLALGLISLVFVINVTGKGNLAPNSAVDQIQNFVLGGIIGGVIYNSSITILQYIVILLMWTILILLLKWLNTNVRFMKHLIDGKPTVIIKNGKLDPEACRSKGLSASDVALKLRGQGIFQLKDVKRAVIEQNGQLIVVRAGMRILNTRLLRMEWFSLKFWKQLEKAKSGCWLNWKKKAMTMFWIFSLPSMTKEKSML